MSRFLSPALSAVTPYTPGEQPQDQQYIKLNTNESPYLPSPAVIAAVSEHEVEKLRLYSDPACAQLLRLDDDLRVVLHERRDALAHVAQDGDDVGDARLMGGVHHPAHERLAQDLMGHFGFIGFHTGAGTRCKNQSFGVHARTFFASAIKTCEV